MRNTFLEKSYAKYQRRIQGRARGARALPFFCFHLFFCDHFKELQTVLFEVELIINDH